MKNCEKIKMKNKFKEFQVKLWELMASYGNLWHVKGLKGNISQVMGNYGKFWELMVSYGNKQVMGTYAQLSKCIRESELIAIYFHMKSKQISCSSSSLVTTRMGRQQLICFDFIWK